MRRANPELCFDFREYEKSGKLKPHLLHNKRYHDSGCEYLKIEIGRTGIRFKDSRKKVPKSMRNIGLFPHMSVTEARNAIKTNTIKIGHKYDSNNATPSLTVEQVYNTFIDQRNVVGKLSSLKPKTNSFYTSCFVNHMEGPLGDLRFDQLDYDTINNWHVAIANRKDDPGTHVIANRCLTFLKTLWNHAIKIGKTKSANVATLIEKFPEKPRTNFIHPNMLAAFWNALANEKRKYYDYYRVLVLVGQRREEVLSMKWQALHLDDPLPHWGPYKSKTSDETITYLSTHVVDILRNRKCITGDSDYVFPSDDDVNKHMTLSKGVYDRIGTVAGLWVEGGSRDKNLTKHDLRRTFGTIADNMPCITERMKKRCLNHKLNKDSTDRYGQPLPEKILEAVQAINDEIIRLATQKPTIAIASVA